MTPTLAELAALLPETEQATVADLDRLRAELLLPHQLPTKGETGGERTPQGHAPSVAPESTIFLGGRL